jgi:hypothetical protein
LFLSSSSSFPFLHIQNTRDSIQLKPGKAVHKGSTRSFRHPIKSLSQLIHSIKAWQSRLQGGH